MSIQNKLSYAAIKKLQPKSSRYKIGDGDKLWLVVSPSGTKTWRILWKVNGVQRDYTIGSYTAISLKEARKERDRVNSLLAQGKKPAQIENQLYVAPSTVKTHVKHIYQKLGIHSRDEMLGLLGMEGELGVIATEVSETSP